jgi:molybdopterin-guanine dinucleotide biosynthesis protein A
MRVGPVNRTVGVVLAGGLSRRMGGGDKCLLPLAGRPLIAHVLDRFQPQSDQVVISANGDRRRFGAFSLPVVADPFEGFAGPLAGILGGMLWTRSHAPEASHVITVAADAPFLPRDLATRLIEAIEDSQTVAVASSQGRVHPVFALWPVGLAQALENWLRDGRNRAVHAWLERQPRRIVEFAGPIDPFLNINTPADLAAAEAWFVRA